MGCPNKFPSVSPGDYRLAIVGNAPGREEEQLHEPFVGQGGRFLKALMGRAGLNAETCFFGNVSQERPFGNDQFNMVWDSPEVEYGLMQLNADLLHFQPHMTLLMGNVAMKAFRDPNNVHFLGKKAKWAYNVSSWRGSLFHHTKYGKAMCTYHPTDVLRNYDNAPILQFDVKKAARQARFPELVLPERNIVIPESIEQLTYLMHDIKVRKPLIAMDIEGVVGAMSCYSIADHEGNAFIVPFSNAAGGNYWENETDEMEVWRLTGAILEDPEIPKVLQNSLYDRFVLQYSYGLCIRGVQDDTMLKHWELYCELEKSLGVQASIYTDEPYYKFERKTADRKVFFEYCCKDSAVTYEINRKLEGQLLPNAKSYAHYRFNVEMLNPLLYMELRGIPYNWELAKERKAAIRIERVKLQYQLDTLAGRGISGMQQGQLLAACRELMTYKRNPSQAKKDYIDALPRALTLINNPNRSAEESGELADLLERSLNVDSAKQFHPYLYETLKLPLQTNKEGQTTADENALIKLRSKVAPGSLQHTVLDTALHIRRLGTHEGMLSIHPDSDGRIRCGYNVVGADTGRITCYTSPTGSGYNLQTIPKGDRDLFTADPDHWFFQCDLSGADGWTVGAHCKALGDPTMLDDLYGGVKPAKVLCLGLRGLTKYLSPLTDRGEIKEAAKQVKGEDWDYFACKCGIWGTCYLMGPDTLRDLICSLSDGEIMWSRQEAYDFQRLVFLRYQVKRWHDWTARMLSKSPVIVSASGHRRMFLGRSSEILSKALAHEPQANTTYATNLAVSKMWGDPENRTGGSSLSQLGLPEIHKKRLRIAPLHQVHDAVCGQFRKDDTDWAAPRIKSYFDNPLVIANQVIIIPYEGGYGKSWGETSEGSL